MRDAITGGDSAAIKSAHDELQSSIQKIGEAVYANAGASNTPPDQDGQAGGGEESDAAAKGDDVVDAEFKEV